MSTETHAEEQPLPTELAADEQPSMSEPATVEQPPTTDPQLEEHPGTHTSFPAGFEEHPGTHTLFPAGFEEQNLVYSIKKELGNSVTDEEVASTIHFLEELDIFDDYEDDDYEDYF